MNGNVHRLLGETLFVGRLQKRDLRAAAIWFERAAHDDDRGLFYSAWCLERGRGVKANADKARELYVESASNGFALAEAWCSANRVHGFDLDNAAILDIYSEPVVEDDMCERLFRPFLLGEAHEQGLYGLQVDERAAIACFKIAASRGLVDAEQRLAVLPVARSEEESAAACSSAASAAIALVAAASSALDFSELHL